MNDNWTLAELVLLAIGVWLVVAVFNIITC
jgi:hypothetical protein